jgi:hypothetical protein
MASAGRAFHVALIGAASLLTAGIASARAADSLRSEAHPANAALTVRERLAQPVSNGCRYLGTVQGKIEPQGNADDARGPSRYAPVLTVSAEVECGRGVVQHVDATRIDGRSYSQSELEAAIRDAARVNVDAGGRVCSYVPDVRVEGTNVSMPSLNESCRPGSPPRR